MNIPKISVVMTAYNVGEYIAQAINSVLNSTEKDIELIVVNDASTDNTLEIINSIKDERLIVINNEENVGAGVSRQIGINAAKGMFVNLIDGDDWISEDYYESLLQRYEETKAPVISGGVTFYVEGKGEVGKYDFTDEEWDTYEDVIRLWGKRLLFLNTMIIKRDILVKTGYSHRRYIEDAQTRFWIMYYAKRIAYSKNVGYFYRKRETSLTNTSNPFKDALYRALCAKDVMLFFKDKDDERWKKIFGLPLFNDGIKNLKKHKPTKEMIEPYKDDFIELMLFMLNT